MIIVEFPRCRQLLVCGGLTLAIIALLVVSVHGLTDLDTVGTDPISDGTNCSVCAPHTFTSDFSMFNLDNALVVKLGSERFRLILQDAEPNCTANTTKQITTRLQNDLQGNSSSASNVTLGVLLQDTSVVVNEAVHSVLLPCLIRAMEAADDEQLQARSFSVEVEDRTAEGYHASAVFERTAEWMAGNGEAQLQVKLVDEHSMELDSRGIGDADAPGHTYLHASSAAGMGNRLLRGTITDVSDVVGSATVHWQDDVFPALRRQLGTFYGRPYAIPYDGKHLMVFYRREAVAGLGGKLPQTWQQFVEAMQALNGTLDYDGDGTNDPALCATQMLGCDTLLWPSYMAASLLSTGTQSGQGVFLSPEDMRPLVNNAAMLTALDYWRHLQGVMQQEAAYSSRVRGSSSFNGTCAPRPTAFVEGRCGVMLGVSSQFQDIEYFNSSNARGNVICDRLPGSTQVLDRQSNALMDCTAAACPLAELVALDRGRRVLVNRPTVLFVDNLVVTIEAGTPTSLEAVVQQAAAVGSLPQASKLYIGWPGLGLSPWRISHLQLPLWVDAWHADVTDTLSFFSATNRSMHAAHVVTDLWLPLKGREIRDIISDFVEAFTLGQLDAGSAMSQMEIQISLEIQAVAPRGLLSMYRGLINYTEPSKGGHCSNCQAKQTHESSRQVLAGVGAVVGVVFLAAVVMLTIRWRAQQRGKRTSPPPGPDTTLLVTDIQGSTTLWEELPPGVMDAALIEHHTLVRTMIAKNNGYESATEGDSFLLAFHEVQHAVQFALDVQRGLMQAAWPPELLVHQLGREVYASFSELDPIQRGVDTDLLQQHMGVGTSTSRAAGYRRSATLKSISLTSFKLGGGALREPSMLSWLEKADGAAIIKPYLAAEVRRSRDASLPSFEHSVTELANGLGIPGQWDNPLSSEPGQSEQPIGPITFYEACRAAYRAVTRPPGSTRDSVDHAVMIFKGLRVRMGIHSGVDSEDIVTGHEGTRVQFSGASMDFTKALSDCAHGGMVAMSQSSYQRLPMEQMWQQVVVLNCGQHVVKDGEQPIQVFQVLERGLRFRYGQMGAVRSKEVCLWGVPDAPLGDVSIVFMYPVGLSTLLAWNADVSRQALRLLHEAAAEELSAWEGYQVEAAEMLLLLSFKAGSNAVMWCLDVQRRMLQMEWPEELLGHELCEEMAVSVTQQDGSSEDRVLMRGLRLKMGIDCGGALSSVNPMTGCIQYRGKVMNRAARIASAAGSGQVMCSSDVWAEASRGEVLLKHGVSGESSGMFRLKGLPDPLELFNCRYPLDDWHNRSRASGRRVSIARLPLSHKSPMVRSSGASSMLTADMPQHAPLDRSHSMRSTDSDYSAPERASVHSGRSGSAQLLPELSGHLPHSCRSGGDSSQGLPSVARKLIPFSRSRSQSCDAVMGLRAGVQRRHLYYEDMNVQRKQGGGSKRPSNTSLKGEEPNLYEPISAAELLQSSMKREGKKRSPRMTLRSPRVSLQSSAANSLHSLAQGIINSTASRHSNRTVSSIRDAESAHRLPRGTVEWVDLVEARNVVETHLPLVLVDRPTT